MLKLAVYAGIERKNAVRAPESAAFAAGIKRSRRLPTHSFWRTAAACQYCPRADERRTGDGRMSFDRRAG